MAQLSNRDLYYEFGSNILLFPFVPYNIKGSSINLSISKYAWDLNTNKKLLKKAVGDGDKEALIVPPYSTVAIATQEIIYVGNNICGTYHSKVGMMISGFSGISTTLDPGYIGTSLICLHNHTPYPQELIIGDTFVTLMIAYTLRPSLDSMVEKLNTPGQRERICDFENGAAFLAEQRTLGYHDNKERLKEAMNSDDMFQKWKAEFKKKDPLMQEKNQEILCKNKKSMMYITVAIYFIECILFFLIFIGVVALVETNVTLQFLKNYITLFVSVISVMVTLSLTKLTPYILNIINERWYKT